MRRLVQKGIEEGLFPGAVVCVSRNGDPLYYEAHGKAEATPAERTMTLDTRFDLSSLTQVVATLPAVLRTVQMGKLSLIDPIARYLPEFATGVDRHAKGQISVFQLLSHTSGLPAWKPFFLTARGVKAYLRALADTPLEAAPGEKAIPSDLGYLLLGFALERIWDRPLQEVCERLVFRSLDLNQTSFAAGEPLPAEMCAASEVGNECERRLCAPYGINHFPWREDVICGEAQDGNAFYGLDGVAGHAGLFSTAADLNRFAEVWVRKGVFRRERYLDATLVTLATQTHTKDLGGENGLQRGFGWESADLDGTLGEATPAMSFGMVGKGNSVAIWCDPVSKMTAVTLTNGWHPRGRDGLQEWLKALHKRIF